MVLVNVYNVYFVIYQNAIENALFCWSKETMRESLPIIIFLPFQLIELLKKYNCAQIIRTR